MNSKPRLFALLVLALSLAAAALASPASAAFGHKGMFGKSGGIGAIGLADGEFDNPTDMSIAPGGQVAVLDLRDCSVRFFDNVGDHVRRWSPGCATSAGAAAGLFAPTSLAVDVLGNVYIADLWRIRVYSSYGVHIRDIGNVTDPSGTGNYMSQASRIDVDPLSGTPNVYSVDPNTYRVTKHSSTGDFIATAGKDVVAGNVETGFEVCTVALDCQNGVSSSGADGFNFPVGVAVSPDGSQLAVLDDADTRVRFFDPATLQLTGRAATGAYGSVDVAFSGNSTDIYLSRPNVPRVTRFEPDGVTFTDFGSTASSDAGQLATPRAAVGAAGGAFWVMDQANHRLMKFTSGGVLSGSVGKNATSGGGFGSAAGSFNRPSDVTVDAAGDIWVADYENHRVQKFDSSFNHLMTIGGAQGTLGGQFNRPTAVARENGFLWVADGFNHRIQKFNASTGAFLGAIGKDVDSTTGTTTGELCTIAANCKAGAAGNGNTEFSFPTDIAFDPNTTSMYVTDQNNQRVEIFDRTSFNRTGGFSVPANSNPRGITVASDGSLYVVLPGAFGTGTVALMTSAGSTLVSRTVTGNPGLNGVAISGSEVLVTGVLANKIFRFDTSLNPVNPAHSQRGSNPGEVAAPAGIAASPVTAGDVFVAEADNHRIQKFGDVTRPTPSVSITAPTASVLQYNDNTVPVDFDSDDGYGNELNCSVIRQHQPSNVEVDSGSGRGEVWVPFTPPGGSHNLIVRCKTPFDGELSDVVNARAIEDLAGPVISIVEPIDGTTTEATSVLLDYDAYDDIDPDPPTCDVADGATIPLSFGANTISVTCDDAAGNSSTQSVVLTRPALPAPPATPPPGGTPDASPPDATIKFAKRIKFRNSIRATVTCDKACPLVLKITARVGKKRYTATARKTLTAAGTTTMTVKFRKSLGAPIRSSLSIGKKVRFSYVLTYGAKTGKSGSVKNVR